METFQKNISMKYSYIFWIRFNPYILIYIWLLVSVNWKHLQIIYTYFLHNLN